MNLPHEPFDQALIHRSKVLAELDKPLPRFRRKSLVEILAGLDKFILEQSSATSMEQINNIKELCNGKISINIKS